MAHDFNYIIHAIVSISLVLNVFPIKEQPFPSCTDPRSIVPWIS